MTTLLQKSMRCLAALSAAFSIVGSSFADEGTTSPKTTVANLEPASTEPLTVIKKYEQEVKDLFKRYESSDDPANIKKRNEEISRRVDHYFDFNELAKRSLEGHWAKLSVQDQKHFQEVFKKLIERSYLQQSRGFVADYDVMYGQSKVDGKVATVSSTVKKDDLDVQIIYELIERNSGWIIYNVIFDDLNLLNNYKSQFNRIIAQKSFPELIEIMEKKLEKPDSAVTKATS